MSGSRGEANFVFKCKNCKVVRPNYSSAEFPTVQHAPPELMQIAVSTERIKCHHKRSAQSLHTQLATQESQHHRARLSGSGVH